MFARAWHLTKDQRYIEAGERALRNLLTPVENAGGTATLAGLDPSLSGYRFFEEYPTKPVYYTLNGFMSTLLGIYDWSHVPAKSREAAEKAFDDGMTTLTKSIHLYDVNGFSAYDLSHVIKPKSPPFIPPSYEAIHVYLLNALNSVKPNATLAAHYKAWSGKIDAANRILRFGPKGIQISEKSPQPVGSVIKIT